MKRFLHYLDAYPSLETRVSWRANELCLKGGDLTDVMIFLQPLKMKDRETYDHSLRVGLLASAMGAFMHLDAKALLFAGLLHDVGKAQTKLATLQKTSGWTDTDTKEVERHVIDGHRMLRDRFDFSAEVILWHHRFQPKSYPRSSNQPLHDYSTGTKVMIPLFGRILSLCDCYDALHRVNEKYGVAQLSGAQIKTILISGNEDQRHLIDEAYVTGIFTTVLIDREEP